MISLNTNISGQIMFIQQDNPPSIYLDHWALRYISEKPDLSKRFGEYLTQKNGTLYISWMNLLEFSQVQDKRHIAEVENFLESIYPQLFFIDVNPKTVIERENEIIKGNISNGAPHNDSALLKYFVTRNHQTLDILNPGGLFSNLANDRSQKMCETFLQKFIDDIKSLRLKRNNDSKYKASIQIFPKGGTLQRATRYIWQDLVNFMIRDNMRLNDTNHFRDLFHTVVPLAYGDFVLLDKTWINNANNTIDRLRKSGHQMEIAKVFSMSNIDIFWDAFEKFK